MRAVIITVGVVLGLVGCDFDRVKTDRIGALCAREFGGDQREVSSCKERRIAEMDAKQVERSIRIAANAPRRP